MIIANGKGRVSTLAVDDDLDMNGRNVTNADVVSVNDHVTLVGARVPGKGFRHVERDGWSMSKDNNDIERKFWKDDFSVDSSSQYTGNVASFTWDTANQLVYFSTEIPKITHNKQVRLYGRHGFEGSYSALPSTGKDEGFALYVVDNLASPTNGIFLTVWHNGTLNSSYYLINKYVNGVATFIKAATKIPMFVVDTFKRFECSVTDTSVDIYINGLLVSTTPVSLADTDCYVSVGGMKLSSSSNARRNIKNLTSLPSESYADDFATDTTERYQPVLGTVAYDDANKRMNVTTATGANGKASGRLKSYKFCEGSQIYDVLLPMGADGDFICLTTHSANGLMTEGIGVGLQSDGAGNWNLATLSGTTVTEGADSGLHDTDVARIEIEKDNKGCYWYYIYDAAGAKPTAATGKLFTTLTEGYTGWYANGAGATTQTYAIENISIRAESIVGRTNVQVTEDVSNSVTGEIESRTYFKPIHRGAMLETYHDGTQEVVGTTFIDDCQWNRLSEYESPLSFTRTHNAAEGCYNLLVVGNPGDDKLVKPKGNLVMGAGVYKFTYRIPTGVSVLKPVYCRFNNIEVILRSNTTYIDGTAINSTATLATNTWYKIEVIHTGTTVYLYRDGALVGSKSGVTGTPSIPAIYQMGDDNFTNVQFDIKDIQFIAASSDATNGIAACIPPIGGGARYGVEEEVYFDIENEVRYNESVVLATVKTLNPANEGVEMFFGNITDSSKITTDDTDVEVISLEDTNYKDVVKDIVLNYDDRGDEIKVGVRKTGDNAATVYVETLAVVPKVEVI